MLSKYRGELLLFLVTFIAALGWFFSKYSILEFPKIGFIGLRFFIAFLLYLPFCYTSLTQLKFDQVIRACIVGLFYALYVSLWLLGLHYSSFLGEGAFIVSLSMLMAPLLSMIFFKEKLSYLFYISLPIAILGLYMLAIGNGELRFSLGSLIFLLSSIVSSIYFILNNRFARDIPVLPLTTLQVGVVGICCSIYSLTFEQWPMQISFQAWGWFTASVLIATNARMFLQTLGQKYCQVGNGAIIMLLEPVWTLILSMLILNEVLSWQKALGCLCILLSIFIYRIPQIFKQYR